MREFLFREFDALAELWQGYADEVADMLESGLLETRAEIDKNLSTIVNVLIDLDKLLLLEEEHSLEQDRAGRARQLKERYLQLQSTLRNKQTASTPPHRIISKRGVGETGLDTAGLGEAGREGKNTEGTV